MRTFLATAAQPPPGGLMAPARLAECLDSFPGTQLVVTPEMAHVRYFPLEADSDDAQAPLTLESRYIRALGVVARERATYVVAGVYLTEGSRRTNSAILIGPDGRLVTGQTSGGTEVDVYDKVHLCNVHAKDSVFSESEYFAAGDQFVIWRTELAAIAVLICYDRHFWEAWATVRAMGAEVVCIPTTSPARTAPTFVAEMQAMALQHNVFVVVSNRVGTERLSTSGTSTEFLGSSCVIDPLGRVLAVTPAGEPHLGVQAELGSDVLVVARHQSDLTESRRPEAYRFGPRT